MRALFVIPIFQFSRETFPVLHHFRERGAKVHVLVGWSGPTADEYVERCVASGFVVHRLPPDLGYGDPRDVRPPVDGGGPSPRRPKRLAPLRRALGYRVFAMQSFVSLVRKGLRIRREARTIMSGVAPDVVLGGPYVSRGTLDQAVARLTRDRGVPYCCLSVSAYIGERNVVGGRFHWFAEGTLPASVDVSSSLWNRLVARAFPTWTRSRDGVRIFMWDPTSMLAARVTGLIEDDPWRQPSSLYDVCFVESDFSREMLVESRYPAEKVVVAGKPLLDDVFERLDDEEYRSRLYADVGANPSHPFLLCNVEPAFEHEYATWDAHWEHFRTVMEVLRDTGTPVVLSLHPLCDPENYRSAAAEYGVRLADGYTIGQLYPYCGASVSFPCSTNVLSLVFGKPLVIYDWFGMTREDSARKDLFRLPGARLAYTREQLAEAVRAVVSSPEFTLGPTAATEQRACETIYEEVGRRVAQAPGVS